jgi:hypothetical protein
MKLLKKIYGEAPNGISTAEARLYMLPWLIPIFLVVALTIFIFPHKLNLQAALTIAAAISALCAHWHQQMRHTLFVLDIKTRITRKHSL